MGCDLYDMHVCSTAPSDSIGVSGGSSRTPTVDGVRSVWTNGGVFAGPRSNACADTLLM